MITIDFCHFMNYNKNRKRTYVRTFKEEFAMNKYMEEIKEKLSVAQADETQVIVEVEYANSLRAVATIVIDDVDYSGDRFMITAGEIVITMDNCEDVVKADPDTYEFRKDDAKLILQF